MFQSKRNNPSSLLELEAADYFKLDPAQVNMLCTPSTKAIPIKGDPGAAAAGVAKSAAMNSAVGQPSPKSSVSKPQVLPATRVVAPLKSPAPKQRSRPEIDQTRHEHSASPRNCQHQPRRSARTSIKVNNKVEAPAARCRQNEQLQLIYSSTASTNSLPSISSSPSISPSLVCPHLKLDDILNGRYVSRSPHTIGLCDRCKLDPPPNIHSPLSPAFKPSNTTTTTMQPVLHNQVPRYGSNLMDITITSVPSSRKVSILRRGYSDFQERTGANSRKTYPIKDDSLDFYLDPSELRRSQMSPIQRNSVGFIRKYSTEVGRILKIYKNGQAFEKPLRVCITRNEFANLNQLLDHINSRQLIPCGARYLFHLDGQLAYSVNELKHGSSYVVSGTRNFDLKASATIKEQQKRELNQMHHLYEKSLQRGLLDRRSSRSLGSLGQLVRSEDTTVFLYSSSSSSNNNKSGIARTEAQANNGGQATQTQVRQPVDQTKRTVHKTTGTHGVDVRDQTQKGQRLTQQRKMIVTNNEKIIRKHREQQQQIGQQAKSVSSENLTNETMMDKLYATENNKQTRGGNLSRAKSELSSAALKRKKIVTFMDTGQCSSPVLRRSKELEDDENQATEINKTADIESGASSNNKKDSGFNNETNEIGIQVSDSIDGYLIDLPLPLPKRGEEKRESQRRFVAARRGGRPGSYRESKVKTKKIVTITERDLSIDELDQLKDLDHGDHYNELHKIKHVVIKLDSAEASGTSTSAAAADGLTDTLDEQMARTVGTASKKAASEEVETERTDPMDRNSTINIGQALEETNQPDPLISKANLDRHEDDATRAIPMGQWQYPGGQRSSGTPEERPVSQNEPNGVVRARVTTPTPSLSTAGDNNSLSMSYDGAHQLDVIQGSASIDKVAPAQVRRGLPKKSRPPVEGRLYGNFDAPERNFRLTWVNGFTINDLYQENSATMASAPSLQVESTQQGEFLSPSRQTSASASLTHQSLQFKPSERFRNWICHSRLHDELIYPAGCLIVLWCRWTNEQRFYSRHATNVSAITLAPTEPDVVASAEIGGGCGYELESRLAGAVIHLWSSTSLETLVIIDEPIHFRGFKIFSMNLRKSGHDSWTLLVGSRDDRQTSATTLQLHDIRVDSLNRTEDLPSATKVTIIKAPSRVLQLNQIPLLVTHMPIETDNDPKPGSPKKKPTNQQQPKDLLLSFGRRQFHLWSPDWPRQKLQLMQASGDKSGALVEIMSRANCLARLAPSEFLIGDSLGNISLLIINLPQQQQQQRKPSKTSSPKRLGSSPKSPAASNKYDLDIVRLVDQQTVDGAQQEPAQSSRSSTPTGSVVSSITSLTRISGSVFASGHSNCVVRFWKIDRSSRQSETGPTVNLISCRQLSCISLPADLGFVCSIVSSGFYRKQSIAEFYLISTSNAILFGSIQLASLNVKSGATEAQLPDVLAHSSLSVVYEGHETSVVNLVADSSSQDKNYYFTCSLDFKICKWREKSLLWKSMLPSACVSLAVHPIGFVLAVGSGDGTVYVLDKVSGLLISYFPLTPVCINCLSYSRDGSLLAAGCANGSIFILPVQENGLKYKKVSIFQSPFPVVSLQFSLDNRYLLTSVTHSQYQDLILWDLPNFRYMRDNVKMVADKINWFEPVCSGSEDVRAIWENVNLTAQTVGQQQQKPNRLARKRPSTIGLASDQRHRQMDQQQQQQQLVVNLSCHRLIAPDGESLCIASDTRGHVRLFKYPCRDIEQAFYQARVTSSRLNCCRFLAPSSSQSFVSSALDGSIFLWTLNSTDGANK